MIILGRTPRIGFAIVLAAGLLGLEPHAQERLAPTVQPADASQLVLLPDRSSSQTDRATLDVAAAVKLVSQGDYTKALPTLSNPTAMQGPLGDYAMYYAGIAQLRLGRAMDARRMFQALSMRATVGYVTEAAALGEAEADVSLNDPAAAVEIYEHLLAGKPVAPDDVLMRLGRAAGSAGDSEKSRQAFARVYYEFPLSDFASSAGDEVVRIPSPQSPSERYALDLGRAQHLFDARQFSAARNAFEALRSQAASGDRELADLRVAESDYHLKKAQSAVDTLRRYSTSGTRQPEALFYYAATLSDLGRITEYLEAIRRLVNEHPTSSWTAQGLDHMATAYILKDDDAAADGAFREIAQKFPLSSYAERAAWKLGWRAYREGRYAETVRTFEQAAEDFPHSDFRPSWLYWSGVAHQQLNEAAVADERYLLTATDYLNSYYGRLASARLGGRASVPRVAAVSNISSPSAPIVAALPPNAALIRTLVGLELYADALNELRFAARNWDDSPAIQATVAWIHQRQGQFETGSKRFTLVRGAITAMRRAYPQFMAAGGETLPRDVLTVIFPLAYWDLVKKYSLQYDLDPYLTAALIAQESTFVPDIKSYAKAVGLMQLMPFTARQQARRVGIRYSSSLLTDPEANIRMGTAYFAQTIKEFGDAYLALASYNAGESAVRRWVAERPGVERDEFIDDIPYPQTQNYVKRILGTADDYRRLYGDPSQVQELLPARRLAKAAEGVGVPPAPGSAASKPLVKKAPQKATPAKKKTGRRR